TTWVTIDCALLARPEPHKSFAAPCVRIVANREPCRSTELRVDRCHQSLQAKELLLPIFLKRFLFVFVSRIFLVDEDAHVGVGSFGGFLQEKDLQLWGSDARPVGR